MGPSWPLVTARDLETKYLSVWARWRMAVIAVRSVEQRASLFFTDLEELFCEYEQHQSASDISLKENLTIRLENAVQALQNLSPFVSDANSEAVLEVTRNFQLMFWNCYRRCEFPSWTRCSQVAVLSLSSPNRVVNGQVGRPKYDIKEETLIELRSLGFSWEDIARMLLVSRWTVHRRVSDFGLNHLPRFSDVADEQSDSKVSAFQRTWLFSRFFNGFRPIEIWGVNNTARAGT